MNTTSTQFSPRTPDQGVRAQIEAAKDYLRAQGFADVEDPTVVQNQGFERNVHTVRMTHQKQPRLLRLSYSWLQERTPTKCREELARRGVAELLRTESPVAILGDGTLQHPTDLP